jgi:putative redox protein
MNKEIEIIRIDDDYLMEASNGTGNTLRMDASESIGGHHQGFRPMEMLLAAVGGCSSIDVINILKKQKQSIDSFAVSVEAEREKVEQHTEFRKIRLVFKIDGEVKAENALKAIQLSYDKYCSVSKILEHTAEISSKLILNGEEII